jgi:hypothetical protein
MTEQDKFIPVAAGVFGGDYSVEGTTPPQVQTLKNGEHDQWWKQLHFSLQCAAFRLF